MKVYITAFALTKGIIEAEAKGTAIDGAITVKEPVLRKDKFFSPFWYSRKSDAVAHAERLKFGAINSYKKKLARLENLRFEL